MDRSAWLRPLAIFQGATVFLAAAVLLSTPWAVVRAPQGDQWLFVWGHIHDGVHLGRLPTAGAFEAGLAWAAGGTAAALGGAAWLVHRPLGPGIANQVAASIPLAGAASLLGGMKAWVDASHCAMLVPHGSSLRIAPCDFSFFPVHPIAVAALLTAGIYAGYYRVKWAPVEGLPALPDPRGSSPSPASDRP